MDTPLAAPPRAARRANRIEPNALRLADLGAVLRLGLRDFARAPLFGLFFASVYVVLGLALVWLGAGLFTWTLSVTLAFPLAAPFLAVGLYEVSRRIERGEPLDWPGVLGVVWRERTRQIPWAGAAILIFVLFWSFVAHMLFALVMGPTAFRSPPGELGVYLSGSGLTMIATQMAFGAVCALLLFALTAVSLPMLLDREVDVVTAMRTSFRAVRANVPVMLIWAAVIAALTFAALLPAFLGLLVVLPVLGHASWHLYRRALPA